VVLTTSAADTDVARSYQLAANCYITKPLDLDAFLSVVRLVDRFWLDIATLPP
jgi:DNA-binding response OmpR family regulator